MALLTVADVGAGVDAVRVWCLRHAESENVVAGTAGALPHAKLTKRGRREASDAAGALAGEPVARVYASTATRSRQTAARIAKRLGTGVVALPELVEVGIGAHEGSVDEAVRAETASVLRRWVVDGDLATRVADGESGHEVVARIGAAFEAIRTAHPGRTAVLVGHVASLTAGLAVLCGLGPAVWGRPLPHALPFLVEWRDGWHCPAWPA
jgi:broad specificity phosphatase PhoE